ncbi:MAG: polyhydroxyalkanoic acid system family protein [Bdellovibrionia bacterium]
MPKITIDRKTALDPKAAFGKIKEFFSTDRDLRKLDSNYQCQFDETGLSGSAKGQKFQAEMSVRAEAGGSRIQVEITLPMLLTPLKGMVEKTVNEKLNALIG